MLLLLLLLYVVVVVVAAAVATAALLFCFSCSQNAAVLEIYNILTSVMIFISEYSVLP